MLFSLLFRLLKNKSATTLVNTEWPHTHKKSFLAIKCNLHMGWKVVDEKIKNILFFFFFTKFLDKLFDFAMLVT